MYSVNGTNITLTRGDTLKLTLTLKESGQDYIPTSGDVIKFVVRVDYRSKENAIKKIIPNNSLLLRLDPEDTKELPFGDYVYEFEITKSNGDVDTFLQGKFKLTEEVEW